MATDNVFFTVKGNFSPIYTQGKKEKKEKKEEKRNCDNYHLIHFTSALLLKTTFLTHAITMEHCYLFHSTDEILSRLADLSPRSWQTTAMSEESRSWSAVSVHVYSVTCFHRTTKLIMQDEIYNKDIKTLEHWKRKRMSICEEKEATFRF